MGGRGWTELAKETPGIRSSLAPTPATLLRSATIYDCPRRYVSRASPLTRWRGMRKDVGRVNRRAAPLSLRSKGFDGRCDEFCTGKLSRSILAGAGFAMRWVEIIAERRHVIASDFSPRWPVPYFLKVAGGWPGFPSYLAPPPATHVILLINSQPLRD